MSKARPYFHDRLVLLLLTINTFIAVVCIIFSLLPLMDSSGTIIAQYRSNLGLDGYRAGTLLDIASFGVFAGIIYAFQLVVSMKLYHIRKHASVLVLMLATILLIFSLIISNALLELS